MSKIGLRVGVPEVLDSMEPIEIVDEFSGLKAAFVERYAVPHVPAEWDKEVEGFYVLLSHVNSDNTFTAYVGKTNSSFASRLRSHVKEKDFWCVAVLFKKNSPEGFTQNQTSYMEGMMVEALSSSPNVKVVNTAATGDRNFFEWDKGYMDSVQLAALRMLFLRGYRNSHMGAITKQLEREVAEPSETVEGTGCDESVVEKLRAIAREIRDSDPTTEKSYQYWSSNYNLRVIAAVKPQTVFELYEISLKKAWHINPYKLKAETIIELFRS